jgi:hypothetical protein
MVAEIEQLYVSQEDNKDSSQGINEANQMILDSGCTETIIKTRGLFKTYGPSEKRISSAVNKASLVAAGEGTIILPVTTLDGTTTYISVTAIHCPNARRNLLSLSSVLKA